MKQAIQYIVFLSVLAATGFVYAQGDVGTMVAVRGKVFIERDQKAFEAKVKDGILVKDTVSTREASRAKMLFTDDSILTLGEKSKAVIRELIYSRDKRGKSVFSLIEGKMRSIVGKTDFEVHTPTAVAAARGTVILFETGEINGKIFTLILCLEGSVTGKSSDEKIPGSFLLQPGMMITIFKGEPLPNPVSAPADIINRLSGETDLVQELSIPGPREIVLPTGPITFEPTGQMPAANLPPVNMQPPVKDTTPVKIDLDWQK
jgi:hypothetical protein